MPTPEAQAMSEECADVPVYPPDRFGLLTGDGSVFTDGAFQGCVATSNAMAMTGPWPPG